VSLEILEPGLLTTVQDLGRFGYQRWGIPTAGAMDPFALKAANALVGNPPNAAGLEITLLGPRLAFSEGCAIAITGAELGPRLNGREIESWKRQLVTPGSILEFSGRRSGARAYLAVSGGIDLEPWLGSRSTYLMAAVGGFDGRALRAGDRLPIGRSALSLTRPSIPPDRRPPYTSEPTVRVVLGPHADRFTEEGIDSFLSGSYQITPSSNRMGYRLEGPKIAHTRGPDLISCGIPLGGIQVPGSGQPIILTADHQTAGGYTMIATVIQADIPLVAQCLPGERLRFRAVGLDEAREALLRQEAMLRAVTQETEGNPWDI
jgi:antagonist of KipI